MQAVGKYVQTQASKVVFRLKLAGKNVVTDLKDIYNGTNRSGKKFASLAITIVGVAMTAFSLYLVGMNVVALLLLPKLAVATVHIIMGIVSLNLVCYSTDLIRLADNVKTNNKDIFHLTHLGQFLGTDRKIQTRRMMHTLIAVTLVTLTVITVAG